MAVPHVNVGDNLTGRGWLLAAMLIPSGNTMEENFGVKYTYAYGTRHLATEPFLRISLLIYIAL